MRRERSGRRLRRRLLAAFLCLALATPGRAAFDDLGAGARAPGLGDAFTALADDVYAIHYNPAGLAQLERPQLGAAYSKLYVGLSDGSDIGSSQLAYAHPLKRGREGTLGVGWERLSLSGLYQEQVLTFSYGRSVLKREDGGRLLAGINAKYLHRSFTRSAEASSACLGLACNQGADPVLSGANSKGTMDADIGALYRFPRRLQAGLVIQHLGSPNVAFNGTDKVERAINAGLAWKSLWLSLSGELKTRKDAAGRQAKDFVLAAERFFPTLDLGQFGIRGSLGLGSSDWRQATVGASYRVNKLQADYAFLLPIGGVRANSGSHRMGLTFHFGAPTADDELTAELLERAKRVQEKGVDYAYEYKDAARPEGIEDPALAETARLMSERRYRLAEQALSELMRTTEVGPRVLRLRKRLLTVASHYPEMAEPVSKADRTTSESVRRFLDASDDRLAVLQASYAASLRPEDVVLSHFLAEMEKETGERALRLPPGHPRAFLDELQWQVEYAHTRGDRAQVEQLLKDMLVLEPDPTTAPPAAPVAPPAPAAPPVVSTAAAPVPPPAPAPEPPAAKPAPKPAPRVPSRLSAGDPRDVEALYQAGVEHYARGEYLQATALFLRVLQIDPNNEPALKALERIERRKPRKRR